MNILLCNTSEQIGGAAIAAKRLMNALRVIGEDARMFVRDASTAHSSNIVTPKESHILLRTKFIVERLGILRENNWHKHHLFDVDGATQGIDLTRQPVFKDADIIHLHWINQGFLSLRNLQALQHTGKPIVWTLHDMWPLTGICHHADDCIKWLEECGHCPLLYKGKSKDLSYRTYIKKRQTYSMLKPIYFVACSDWLANLARRAPLLQGHPVYSIPNAIDTDFYTPAEKSAARTQLGLPQDADVLLFVSYKATNKNKGIDYLREAINRLITAKPEKRDKLHLIVVGREATTLQGSFAIPTHTYEYVTSEETMRNFYRAASILCMPTLFDNLPNTIVEAMACGTPTVGFDIGGLPQLIHPDETGYLSNYKDAEDFAHGIDVLLDDQINKRMGSTCRAFTLQTFSQTAIAKAYARVYEEAYANT